MGYTLQIKEGHAAKHLELLRWVPATPTKIRAPSDLDQGPEYFFAFYTPFKHTKHFMGHHPNFQRYSGTTKHWSIQQKAYADGPMLLEQKSLALLDLTELSQACKCAKNYQRHLYGLQKKIKHSQKRVKTQAEDLGKKATYIGDLENEIAYLTKKSEVMMSKMTLQIEGRVEDRKQLHSLKAKIK
ncbi:hypothetical protein ARMGADRAFT_1029145 [Armillaria gallica]|uniref:Uncharacterized protein n=1 Tax=Armillaria gallica TaxID=47427 RepID=A0A2H3E2J5_ARMGA|nr:hypothetical protein ARMGADRAFT_1029145 [Armillaria gallica]